MTCLIRESAVAKAVSSNKYNYLFNKVSGQFFRWGTTKKDDPSMSPYGPEIADIEISTSCSGVNGKPCSFCYKSNTQRGENMSLDTFKKVFSTFPKILTQIAFGIGDIDANPDIWDIFSFCRENGVVPNVTINGSRMDEDKYNKLSNLCGAVAVSRYSPKDVCYNAVEQLSLHGLNQVNIHQLLSAETYDSCMELLDDAKSDPRLSGLRAIVFLALKKVGRGKTMNTLSNVDKYRALVEKAINSGVGIGFDSCSAPMFLKAMTEHKDYQEYETLAEPCESLLFSIYVDVTGKVYPCSFLEHSGFQGIDLTKVENFMKEAWYNPEVLKWRDKLLSTTCGGLVEGCRQCPVYDIY